LCAAHGITADRSGLPTGVRRLLELADAVPERSGARAETARLSILARIGMGALRLVDEANRLLAFLGQTVLAFGSLLRGRARLRAVDLWLEIQGAGADALPIVTLISFLVGVIMAFVGAVQLQKFGAEIYVADLVGIAVVREMGAMMTGIVMAGRTGAAFAAALGTMQVTQEIDALTTMGISPIEFLVLPRALALCLMMPLLCLYSDLIGIFGGAVIASGMLGISLPVYFNELFRAVSLTDLAGGVFKASVYGVLIAIAGCLRGMECGTSASAVGDATTSAVVTGIVLIISACGVFAVTFYVLGI
jgi:phospholipid/cholesterol/gamma-HCH transport system permease protein